MNPIAQLKPAILPLLTVITFAGMTVTPSDEAALPPPPPSGAYPGQNTAAGQSALQSVTTGDHNTAIGYKALTKNTGGDNNTSIGAGALGDNTGGNSNTATGQSALNDNTTGNGNTATGAAALTSNTTGRVNTAMGSGALSTNTTGDSNIALGFAAGVNLTTGDNNIDIGNRGVAGESNTIRIGTNHAATFIAGIHGETVAGAAVFINDLGRLGTLPSSQRFKDDIKPMGQLSEVLFALQPVTFHYKKELDPAGGSQFGLVAEQVEKVNPDLVVRNADGKVYSVRYDQVNAMLLNEFLKEHQTVQELKTQVAALTAGLQRVSAQIELRRPAPQTVARDH
jgi:hypothetical protein